ncbi:MAG: hypothetical protein ABIH89_07970 [Elusimicrobiota bacterium]
MNGDSSNFQITGESVVSGISASTLLNGDMFIGITNYMGCEIWQTSDGSTWTQDAKAGNSDTDMFSPVIPCVGNFTAIMGAILNGYIFAGTYHIPCCGPPHRGELWRSGSPWEQITEGFGDDDNLGVIPAYKLFNGYLYVGTSVVDSSTTVDGADIWRTTTGNNYNSHMSEWEKVVDFHAVNNGTQLTNNDSNCREVTSFSVPGDGYLYVAVKNTNTGAEIWRTNGESWEQVNIDGFGTAANTAAYLSREKFNNTLYAGTSNSTGGRIYKAYMDSNPITITTDTSDAEYRATDRGSTTIVGSSNRKGIINPDKGDIVEVAFKGDMPGKIYT